MLTVSSTKSLNGCTKSPFLRDFSFKSSLKCHLCWSLMLKSWVKFLELLFYSPKFRSKIGLTHGNRDPKYQAGGLCEASLALDPSMYDKRESRFFSSLAPLF